MGKPDYIDIIEGWGLGGDYHAGSALKHFLIAPYNGNEEEDYRESLWHLEKIYERDIGNGCDILCHDRLKSSPIRIRCNKINLFWFKTLDFEKEITLKQVVTGWHLTDKRLEFTRNFFYQNFNIEKCLRAISDILDDVSDDEDKYL